MSGVDPAPADSASHRLRQMHRAIYDRMAREYGLSRSPVYDAFRDEAIEWFAGQVKPVGADVVDLGSGPGHEALLLRARGLKPLTVDISPRMVEQCRAAGLDARVMDFLDIDLPDASASGVWMSFSLLHVPKAEAGRVLRGVRDLLRPGGVLAILGYEGEGEGVRVQPDAPTRSGRYFALYREAELRELAAREFEVLTSRRLENPPRSALMVGARKPVRTVPPQTCHDGTG